VDQKVIWTFRARKSLRKLIEWLSANYNEEYAERTLRWILSVTNEVAEHPSKGMIINRKRGIRRWPIDAHNYVTYSISASGIVVKNIMAYKNNKKGF
jgi:plasmid stabilization system protein ParE